MEKQALKSIADQMQSITEITAFSVSPGLNFQDNEAIEDVIKGTKQSTDLVYIVIFDDNSNVFASYSEEIANQTNFLEAKDKDHISPDGTIYRTIMPILHNNVKIGQLYIGLSLEDLNAEIRQSKIAIALVIFVALSSFLLVLTK